MGALQFPHQAALVVSEGSKEMRQTNPLTTFGTGDLCRAVKNLDRALRIGWLGALLRPLHPIRPERFEIDRPIPQPNNPKMRNRLEAAEQQFVGSDFRLPTLLSGCDSKRASSVNIPHTT